MRDLGLGGYRSIDEFVKAKLEVLKSRDISFLSLFELMFSEEDNVLYEQSAGYRILRTTYGEAKARAKSRAAALCDALNGAGHNSVVGLYMENGPEWIITFWALILAGYRPLLMNMRLPEDVLGTALSDMNAFAVVSDSKTFSVPTFLYSDLKETAKTGLPEKCGDEVFVMSSGTTKNLKICGYTANEFYYQVLGSYDIIKRCKQVKKHFGGHLKLLDFLPFYHIFGLVAVYIWFAFFSRTFVHLNDMNPSTVVNTVKRHNVTHIFAVPLFWETVYNRAMKTIKSKGEKTEKKFYRGLKIARKIGDVPVIGRAFTKFAFRSVREKMFGESISFMITGGSYIRGEILEFFNLIGYPLANGYGMTEIGITSVELSRKNKARNSGSVGEPLYGIEYAVSEEGELKVRGKVCAHSITEGGKTRLLDGWYNTGDIAERVNRSYFISGRRDDVIVAANGENLNPEIIEPYFCVEGINGVALISEKSEKGNCPILLVSIKRTATEKNFKAVDASLKAAAENAGIAKLLGKIVYTGGSLLGENDFKVNRTRLSEEYNRGKLEILPAGHFKPENEGEDAVLLRVKDLFAAALGEQPEDIRVDADFFLDEGGTSLDYFAFVSELEEEFGVSFPNEGGSGLNTVSAISDFVKAGSKNAL